MRDDELPLFPLHSVLFPGGDLRLRVVEPRHSDIIRWCAREARPFGACLLLDDAAGAAAVPAAIGTEARIADFYTGTDGLLGIRAAGGARFHVRRAKVRDNGVIIAEVDRLPQAAGDCVQPEHALLVVLLDHLLDHFGGNHAQAPRQCFDQAEWVGFRLAELLPFADAERQRLLQVDDPHERLDRIVHRLPELREQQAG